MKASNVWVIIPAYNEEKRISEVIKKIKKYANKVVVIDDGSKDKTYDAAKRLNVIALKHIVNLGKGAALKTGCDFALKRGAEAFIAIDADAQHDPDEIPKFIKNLNRYDIIFGCRKKRETMPLVLKFGNWFIHAVTKILYKTDIKDTQCGYRAFTKKAYEKIRWKASDYSMESEMVANAGKNKLKYTEVPIQTFYLNKYKGTTILDGVKIVFNMIWWRLTR
ncbi:glycosyltransferase family 2 protein [Candidatus Woesearchaeota archaeon]|nr:glycosyltransferase family 2 protein [Candidatus Woesearchaeota archaeon]